MSAINEALKRAARLAAGGQPAGPPSGPLPEKAAEPAIPDTHQTGEPAAAAPEPVRRSLSISRVPRWALALGALLVLGLAYARVGDISETQSAAAEPTVYRQKIVDDRERLLAELPEGDLAEEAAEPAPEGPEQEAARENGGRPEGPAPAAPERSAPAAIPAVAGDEDDEEDEDEDLRDEEAPPAPSLPEPEARAAQAVAARPAAPAPQPVPSPTPAPQRLPAPRPVPGPQQRPTQPPSAPSPPNGTAPAFTKNGVPPYGPLPARQFAYAAPQAPPGAAPAKAGAQETEQDVTDEIFRQAVEQEDQGKRNEAAALYALVLQKDPERETASLRLSSLLYRQGRYPEAAEILRRAIKARESSVLRNNLGTVYLAQGKLNEARQELMAAAAMDEAYADPHYNLACYHVLSGQHQEGLAELEKAKSMNPQVMEWAAQDVDLAALRAMPEYKRLTE